MSQQMVEIPAGPFQPTWESLEHYGVPQWYVDGKFGIFIHWGVYSVPGFGNEWYPRHMYRAEKYDPDHWADVFQRAGAKFIVPVAEHHDGFAMYDTRFSDWSAVKMG